METFQEREGRFELDQSHKKTPRPTTPRAGAQGDVVIHKDICKGCAFCIEFCPRRCLEFSHDFNAKGYHYPELVRPEDCTGCDLCGIYCPDFAIYGFRVKKPSK